MVPTWYRNLVISVSLFGFGSLFALFFYEAASHANCRTVTTPLSSQGNVSLPSRGETAG